MIIRFAFVLVLGLQLCYSSVEAQNLEECKNDIHEFYAKKKLIDSEKGYFIKYGVRTVYKDKKMSDKEVVFSMIYKNNQVAVKSDLLETYADSAVVISLSPMSHKIVVQTNSKKEFDLLVSNATQMSDSSLWKSFDVISCSPILNHKEYNAEVILQSKKTTSAIVQMSYLYKKESADLYKVINTYNKASAMEKLTYTFYTVAYNYNGSELQTNNVYSLIFDAKGKPLPAYKNYEVIDQRKSKK